MFLVDPNITVLSTSNIPPQRKDWWAEEVRKVARFQDLPLEIFEHIIDDVEDMPMSWREALEVRENLMDERRVINNETIQAFEVSTASLLHKGSANAVIKDTFSFCEH